MRHIIRELNHIGIRTSNLHKSIILFQDILGGQIIRDITIPSGKLVFIQIINSIIELIEVKHGSADTGITHVAFRTMPDIPIEQCQKILEKCGCIFTIPPKIAASGNGKIAFFKDSLGMQYELIERETDYRQPTLPNRQVTAFDGIVLTQNEQDITKTETFFTEVLGFQKTPHVYEENGQVYKQGKDTIQIKCAAPGEPKIYLQLHVQNQIEFFTYLQSHKISCAWNKNTLALNGPDDIYIKIAIE
jgi:catechol 2,3-dioxygenase-like lactoylglutathione lyase family enzyme